MRISGYYRSSGFTPYWFAHVIFNVVRQGSAFARNLEELFGDMRASSLCNPFPRFSNLHAFIEDVTTDILLEGIGTGQDEGYQLLRDFLKHAGLPTDTLTVIEERGLAEMWGEPLWVSAHESLVEEVFHILFRDVVLLSRFNQLTSDYIISFGEYVDGTDARFTKRGRLKRQHVPQIIKNAIFHRDGGECRSCKRSLDRIVNPEMTERYDHIIPLAEGGANDVTNLQLLCERCNSSKSSRLDPVSPHYIRAYPLRASNYVSDTTPARRGT